MSRHLQGQLFGRQALLIRGLKTRIAKLARSRSVDQKSLDLDCQQLQQAYALQHAQLQANYSTDLRTAITNWDELLDRQLSLSERETLQSRKSESQKAKQLKTKFVQEKGIVKSQYEAATEELKHNLENARATLLKNKENIKAKLEQERVTLDQLSHECREWVGLKTGDLQLQNSNTEPSEEWLKELAAVHDLKQIAAPFEKAKSGMQREMARLRSHPVVKFVGSYWFLSLGLLMGIVAAAIAWSYPAVPLIVGLVGVVTTVVSVAVLHFSTAPLVAKTMRRLFPAVVAQEQLAFRILSMGHRIADASYQNEIHRREQATAENQSKLDAAHRANRQKLLQAYNENLETLKQDSAKYRETISKTRVAQHLKIDANRKPKVDQISEKQVEETRQAKTQFDSQQQAFKNRFIHSQKFAVSRWEEGCNSAVRRMEQLQQMRSVAFPNWNSECFTTGNWVREGNSLAWPIGDIDPNPQLHPSFDGLPSTRLEEQIKWPVFFDLLSHGALILETHPECKEASNALLRNTLLRAETSLPPGSLHVTIIDPEGLGKQFSWLMPLADVDPALVNHRVWTQGVHIAEQLSLAARHVEDTIQQSLRDKYKNLIEYNQVAGPMAVPYRLIVWANFPFGLDDYAWQALCSILSSGGKCGVGVILQISHTHAWPTFADPAKVREFGLKLRFTPQALGEKQAASVTIEHPEFASFELQMESPPDDDRLKSLMEQQVNATLDVGKRIIPFDSIQLQEQDQQQATSFDGLSIPIGIADSGRAQSLKLGQGTAQHVLIAGKTGSGKSSLLHTLITSAAMKYGPDQLRLVLLDFKKGVEFQVYAESAISHADVIGIESKREFGVSALEYVDRILTARGEAFRQWGVQDLGSLARKHPQYALPRLLILIDEFQELFVEDDKVSQQASLLMDRIVRQGRSFGVHLILASQTLGGAYSLPRTTLSQMGVRIALQCDSADAMLILSEDNTVAERLRHSGQAIYNDAGGRFESNQNFQVAYVEKSEQVTMLSHLKQVPIPQSQTINPLGRQIVFEGHKPAIWDDESLAFAISTLPQEPGNCPLVLGDSVSIDPPLVKILSRTAGRNVMVVGQDETCAANLLASLVAGVIPAVEALQPAATQPSPTTVPSIWLLDGSRKEDRTMSQLVSRLRDLPHEWIQIADVHGLDSFMESLQTELNRRQESPTDFHPSVIVAIGNLARFRDLRKGEEYSFGDDSNGQAKPDAVLANLLRDGPSLGMHVWIWADSAGTLARWIPRQSLRDIELRILMQMSASDSNQLIDANTANRLDRYVVLVHDDVEGKAIKLRPYGLDQTLKKLAR